MQTRLLPQSLQYSQHQNHPITDAEEQTVGVSRTLEGKTESGAAAVGFKPAAGTALTF